MNRALREPERRVWDSHTQLSQMTARLIRQAGNLIARGTRANGRLCIVNYHRVLKHYDALLDSEPDVHAFTWQMELLADCFNVMSLKEGVAALYENRLPPRAVCITFDDGYRSTYELAYPILRQLNLPATVFVTSGHVGTDNMWNDKIIEVIRSHQEDELDLQKLGLGVYAVHDTHAKRASIERLIRQAKYLEPHRRQQLVEQLDIVMQDHSPKNQMLTSDMLRQMVRDGFSIGAHTVSHPILAKINNDEACKEIRECKLYLESLLNQPIEFFAYPNGKREQDFDERHIAMVKEAGYIASFTTAAGASNRKHDRFQIPRGRPWDKTPVLFAIRLLRWLAGET